MTKAALHIAQSSQLPAQCQQLLTPSCALRMTVKKNGALLSGQVHPVWLLLANAYCCCWCPLCCSAIDACSRCTTVTVVPYHQYCETILQQEVMCKPSYIFTGSAITGPVAKECADLWPRIASAANSIV